MEKTPFSFFSTILLVITYDYIFEKLDIKNCKTGEMLGIPLQMQARVKEENPDLTDKDFLILKETILDYSVLVSNYLPANSDSIKGNGMFLHGYSMQIHSDI